MGGITLNTAHTLNIERRIDSCVTWHANMQANCLELDNWLHYTQSLTLALAKHNFNIDILFNCNIQGVWHRHIILYAFNRPFIYAITRTKHPYMFGIHTLGKKSIGHLLFQAHIKKTEFEFCRTPYLYIPYRSVINTKNISCYGRRRYFIKTCGHARYTLELHEFFI